MFQRVQLEEWYLGLKVVGMLLFFLAFSLVLFRAFSMPKRHADRMNALPLADDQDSQP